MTSFPMTSCVVARNFRLHCPTVAKRHELEAKKSKNSWGSTVIDYDGAVKAYTKTLDKTDRAKLAFELLINSDSTISTLELASSLHNESASLRRGFFVARYSA